MKKPYIKKFSKIANFTVFIVDGTYIRNNINEEFTNYGQHYLFKFIPENEFWIDNERVPGEEKYFIDSMLAMNRFMAKGMSHDEAVKKADAVERRERATSSLMKKDVEVKKHEKEVIESLHKKFLKQYSTKEINVWIVSGEIVRNLFFLDFTEGGHEYVYSFVPKGEVWIDDDVGRDETKYVLLHEMHERKLMAKGMKYDPAHKSSSEIEYYCRKHPKELDKNLKKEIKENSK
jgi:hypothetical protein